MKTRTKLRPDVAVQIKALHEARKSFKNNPKKAKEWLISVGILNKKGTALARRYR